ncbi:putative esterase [Prauserella sp. Am3]|nr:putative esterase [Prauserella sp. Am3]
MTAAMHEWGADPDRAALAVLTVHGRGQDPSFMEETARRLGPVPVRFFAPEAEGNTWYPLSFLEPAERNEPALSRSLRVLDSAVDTLAGAGFPAERVVLWGFSQGACLASHLALTAPRAFAGLVLFTGGYIGTSPPAVAGGGPLRGVPTVMRSIEHDPWVPRYRVDETADLLRRAGARVDLRVDEGDEHIITDEACAAATTLLTTVANGSAGTAAGHAT